MTRAPRTPSRDDDPAQTLRLFVEGVRDYAVIILATDGTITSWNAGAEAIKGYKAADIVGRDFSVFYTPEDIAIGKPAFGLQQAAETGRFEDTGPRVRADGTRFVANVVISAIRNERGRLVGFGKIVRDVSTGVEPDGSLYGSMSRLRALLGTMLNTLVDGLIVIDGRGRMQVFNKACEHLFGYTPREVIGQNVRMLMPADRAAEHDQYLANYQRTGVRRIIGISREVMARRRDGTTFPIHLAIGEASHLGEPIYIGIIRDLTERHSTEAQLRQAQKMEVVGQLTGGLAHDFNNILMVVLANVDSLLEQELGARDRERVEQIEKATLRAAELTRQLLAFSRRQALQPKPTDLNDLVTSTGKLLQRTLGENVEIAFSLMADLWTTHVDRTQFESALVNLAVNARDAMPSGGRLLIETRNVVLDGDYVATNPDAVAGPYVLLAISDTGTGIAPDVIDKVFEPFFTTKESGRGTGLGLSMVYGFIKQSNGHIKIYSELGRGTTVKLYLPRSDQDPGSSREEPIAPMPRGSERILLVEDDAQVRERVVEQLQDLGYDVVEASDGTTGLAAFESAAAPFDLVLTDVVMPGAMGGKAMADAILARRPGTPIVFMSGYTEDAMFRHGRLEPGVHLLGKPFRRRDLARMLRHALDEDVVRPSKSAG